MKLPEHYYRVPAYYRKHMQDPKVRIGCAYQPAIKITPAIEIHITHKRPSRIELIACAMGVLAIFLLAGALS